MAEDLDDLRQRLKVDLPAHLGAAAHSYRDFIAAECPADAKGFAAWHAAAKAALSHMELLVKLARWAEGGEAEGGRGDGIEHLLAEARAALDALDAEETGDEETGE